MLHVHPQILAARLTERLQRWKWLCLRKFLGFITEMSVPQFMTCAMKAIQRELRFALLQQLAMTRRSRTEPRHLSQERTCEGPSSPTNVLSFEYYLRRVSKHRPQGWSHEGSSSRFVHGLPSIDEHTIETDDALLPS
jgi:hypothetical protein